MNNENTTNNNMCDANDDNMNVNDNNTCNGPSGATLSSPRLKLGRGPGAKPGHVTTEQGQQELTTIISPPTPTIPALV